MDNLQTILDVIKAGIDRLKYSNNRSFSIFFDGPDFVILVNKTSAFSNKNSNRHLTIFVYGPKKNCNKIIKYVKKFTEYKIFYYGNFDDDFNPITTDSTVKVNQSLNTKKSLPLPDLLDFDYRLMSKRCLDQIESFFDLGEMVDTPDGPYIFIDRGSNVLAVAHLDMVQEPTFSIKSNKLGQPVVYSRALDDRLGAYLILDYLPSIGVVCDILLTVGEEQRRSTSKYFQPTKEYNWMFQFDRTGTDVVCYQYEDDDLCDKLLEIGAEVNPGMFSDICFMDNLGIKGVNFGCGYYDNHGPQSHATMTDTSMMVDLFLAFFRMYANTKLPHDNTMIRRFGNYSSYDNSYKDIHSHWYDHYNDEDYCPVCSVHVTDALELEFMDKCGYCYECLSVQQFSGYERNSKYNE